MNFSTLMKAQWTIYRATVDAFQRGDATLDDLLAAHRTWLDAMAVFEREVSASSNYGAF